MGTDLAAVTRTLSKLVELELQANGVNTSLVKVSQIAPDFDSPDANTVSIYMYHLMETPEFKNLPPVGGTGPSPIQHAPMGLVLQYIITVLNGSTDPDDPTGNNEQTLTGYVARGIHDYPIVDKTTVINPLGLGAENVLDQDLIDQDQSIEFILRPAPREETVAFWSAMDQKVPRLSLFVEARVAILEPKPATQLPGVVLTLGTFVFPGSGPQLTSSNSEIRFFVPDFVSTDLQKISATPARVAVFPTNIPPDPGLTALNAASPELLLNNHLTLKGLDLTPGQPALRLQRGALDVLVDISPTATGNPEWNFAVGPSEVTMEVQETVDGLIDGASGTAAIHPGLYTARVLLRDARFGDKPRTSNAVALSIVPQILSVDPISTDRYSITIVGHYLLDDLDIVLAVRGERLEALDSSDPLTAGMFEVVDDSTIEFIMPDAITDTPSDTNPFPINLVINGAIATPAWLTDGGPP